LSAKRLEFCAAGFTECVPGTLEMKDRNGAVRGRETRGAGDDLESVKII
jgi:hypothetical protein